MKKKLIAGILSALMVTSLVGCGSKTEKEEAPEGETPAVVEEVKPAKKPSLKSMKKAQLIEFAKENNIELDEKATNAVLHSLSAEKAFLRLIKAL